MDRLSTDVCSSGEGHDDDDDDDDSHADERFVHPFPWRTIEEQRWALPHCSGPRLKPLSGMQSAYHLQASSALFDIQTNTCQKSMSHLTQLLEIGKNLNFFLAPKNRWEEGQMWVLFQPSVHVLNIDFYGRLKGLVLLSTKMSKNNRPVKVLHSARCLHNKLLQIQFVFFFLTSAGTAD